MNESYKNQIPVEIEKLETSQETIANLRNSFSEAETVFKENGRESVKPLLPNIYNTLIKLNKLDPAEVIYPLGKWNPEGDLTEDEFNELNRRRKILSNAVGIMTSSGVVRHNLNPDVPEGFE
ncbi:MAG: hypothetical protein WC069_06060 [Candidatus Shapirobacteria bacterium]|jgi:hypothetical protein